jgi:hypothetical protein
MRRSLHPHPITGDTLGLSLEVEARRSGDVLSLEYLLTGPVERVRWPEPAERVHTDGLWGATCFEAFVSTGQGYLELNLSPSGAWAAYRFDGYREGMRPLPTPAPSAVLRQAPGRMALTADVILPEDATGLVGLSAVVETLDGATIYWALVHPSDKPDFHHPDSFTLTLEP